MPSDGFKKNTLRQHCMRHSITYIYCAPVVFLCLAPGVYNCVMRVLCIYSFRQRDYILDMTPTRRETYIYIYICIIKRGLSSCGGATGALARREESTRMWWGLVCGGGASRSQLSGYMCVANEDRVT